MKQFLSDVLKGLRSTPKYLDSKYFYDKKGDELFQEIMASDEYYLTNSEMEIFSGQTVAIADSVLQNGEKLEVIEFGAGDATKSTFLLKELAKRKAMDTYFPIDISDNIIRLLTETIPVSIPGISIHGLNGEYFEMLSRAATLTKNKKLVLFLGANIGNFRHDATPAFCKKLRSLLSKDDVVIIGFDLKKNPKKILAAYNDASGYTREFNLNLLRRINRELNANFDLKSFEHYATYDPDSGACKSYLVSLKKQQVCMGENCEINFEKDETIFMEISQKYSAVQIDALARESGFTPTVNFFDSNRYFVDVIWKC
ncbi:MAG TPA: L-histidine N(alpha)-methyltransferase [Hanamia sp.]|nr:L-histidine N(alpha)-methyltransferase [Hanamia sp.]